MYPAFAGFYRAGAEKPNGRMRFGGNHWRESGIQGLHGSAYHASQTLAGCRTPLISGVYAEAQSLEITRDNG